MSSDSLEYFQMLIQLLQNRLGVECSVVLLILDLRAWFDHKVIQVFDLSSWWKIVNDPLSKSDIYRDLIQDNFFPS